MHNLNIDPNTLFDSEAVQLIELTFENCGSVPKLFKKVKFSAISALLITQISLCIKILTT